MASTLLQITWYEEGVAPSDPVVNCGTCAMGKKTAQNAGHAFWDKYERPLCPNIEESTAADEQPQSPKAQAEKKTAFEERKARREKEQKERDGGLVKISDDLKDRDLYALLEIEPCATTEDIKKAYKKMALVHHPDKMKDPTEEQKKHFILIQEAVDILSDPVKRRRFESTLKFDDNVPQDLRKGYKDNFFEEFHPVFKRNARWSARPKVPDLGDAETPIEEVKKFYEFWRNFESWRDPLAMAVADEIELHNLEEAECREEKRWMERENAKIARKIAQEERERVAFLVKTAEKHDPRMIAYREKVAADKEAEKAQKAAAAEAEKMKKEREEREAAEVAEAARLAEQEKKMAERKAKDEVKNVLKGARQRVRNLHKNAEPTLRRAVHIEQLQEVCLALGTEDLCKLAEQVEQALKKDDSGCGDAIELFHSEIRKACGVPIEDDSVQFESESTATPDSCDEEEAPCSPVCEDSPTKAAKGPTADELEAERLREAEEQAKREKKAEEQRKKKEQKRREEEKRQAAQNRAAAAQRAKERKAQEKAVEEASQKVETAPAEESPAVSAVVDHGIYQNTILVVLEEATIFESTQSSKDVSVLPEGSFLVAAGAPEEVDGYDMVPLQPMGAVELGMVKKFVMKEASLVQSEKQAVVDTIEDEDEAVAEETAPVVSVAPATPSKTSKASKQQAEEEDLDSLLNEFGVVLQPATKGSKKKGKK